MSTLAAVIALKPAVAFTPHTQLTVLYRPDTGRHLARLQFGFGRPLSSHPAVPARRLHVSCVWRQALCPRQSRCGPELDPFVLSNLLGDVPGMNAFGPPR